MTTFRGMIFRGRPLISAITPHEAATSLGMPALNDHGRYCELIHSKDQTISQLALNFMKKVELFKMRGG